MKSPNKMSNMAKTTIATLSFNLLRKNPETKETPVTNKNKIGATRYQYLLRKFPMFINTLVRTGSSPPK